MYEADPRAHQGDSTRLGSRSDGRVFRCGWQAAPQDSRTEGRVMRCAWSFTDPQPTLQRSLPFIGIRQRIELCSSHEFSSFSAWIGSHSNMSVSCVRSHPRTTLRHGRTHAHLESSADSPWDGVEELGFDFFGWGIVWGRCSTKRTCNRSINRSVRTLKSSHTTTVKHVSEFELIR